MQSTTALPTFAALLLAALFGACSEKGFSRNPPPRKDAPASVPSAVGFHLFGLKGLAAPERLPWAHDPA
jgi:hypothetical protein